MTTIEDRLIARPRWEDLRVTGSLAGGFAIFWLAAYGGTSLLAGLHAVRFSIHLGGEPFVPFVPWMSVVYLSLVPLMLMSLLVFRTWEQIVPLLCVLVAETLAAAVFFALLPVREMLPREASSGFFGAMFTLADFMNLEGNYFPSLHVAYAFTAAAAIGRRGGSRAVVFFMTWAAAIAVSTVFLHQHYLVDIAGAVVLTAGGMMLVHPRVESPEFLRAVRLEMTCLAEMLRFARRDARYLVVALGIYGRSLFRWRRLRGIRAGFCLMQQLDDILDGDRPSPVEPLEVAENVLRQMRYGSFDDSSAGRLARCLWEEAARFENGDAPRQEVMGLIEVMQQDRVRARDRLLLSREELRDHHRATFHPAVNLMLVFGGAELRARDVPDLIELFGWCSTMRDLREDMKKGLVNIPASVVREAEAQGLRSLDFDSTLGTPAMRSWMAAEHERAKDLLERSDETLSRLARRKGAALLRMFHRSIQRFESRIARRHEWLKAAPPRAGRSLHRHTGP